MQHAAELPQRMVHRHVILFLAAEDLRDAQDDVVRRVLALHLHLPCAVEVDIHERVGDIARLRERHDREIQPMVDLRRVDAVADGLALVTDSRAVRHPDGVHLLVDGPEGVPQELLLRLPHHLTVNLVDKDVLRVLNGLAILRKDQVKDCIRHRHIAVDVRHPIVLHRDHLLPITSCSAIRAKQSAFIFLFYLNIIHLIL